MSKSMIYTANTSGVTPAIGSTVPVGSIIRRKGNCIDASGSAINLREPGYYAVAISATLTAAAVGTVTLNLQQNGVNVPGATASVSITTANTQIENIAIVAIIRVLCCGDAALTVSVGGTTAPTISNLAITVTRE